MRGGGEVLEPLLLARGDHGQGRPGRPWGRAQTAVIVIIELQIIEGALQLLRELRVDPPGLLSVLLFLLPLLLPHRVHLQRLPPSEQAQPRIVHPGRRLSETRLVQMQAPRTAEDFQPGMFEGVWRRTDGGSGKTTHRGECSGGPWAWPERTGGQAGTQVPPNRTYTRVSLTLLEHPLCSRVIWRVLVNEKEHRQWCPNLLQCGQWPI